MSENCFHVLAPNGGLVRSFGTEEGAHAFAHEQSTRPGAAVPLELDNRRKRVTRFVWPDRCESRRWMALDRAEPCPILHPVPNRRSFLHLPGVL